MSLFHNPNESDYQGGKKHILESLKNAGPAGVLVWKQPEEDFNTHSVLTVNPGEEAVFVKNGEIVHVFGNGRHVLTTENYAFLSRLRNMLSGGISTFNCFVYFVRKADSQEVLWGTDSPIQLRDPVQGIATSIKAHGSYKVMVDDSVKFITKLMGSNLKQLKPGDLGRYFSNQFQQGIKATIAKGLKSSNEELLGICAELDTFANKITPLVGEILAKYGLKLQNFSISAMDIPEDDPNRQLLEGAFARKREFDVMGKDYQQIKGMEIMREMAGNTTSNDGTTGNMAGMGMGMGMGMAAGSAFGQMASNIFNKQGAIADGSTMGSATADDPLVKLTTLKKMLDAGLITQQEYDSVKQQVLSKF
ncbi:MAG: SPFH domain-containing protein [Muribaculaceae bacterium]|nr:SPFH domain-containing protein [Muribaculaceae bacterium]